MNGSRPSAQIGFPERFRVPVPLRGGTGNPSRERFPEPLGTVGNPWELFKA